MTYDPIDYACIDKTDFWIVNEDELGDLDVKELENLIYEEVNSNKRSRKFKFNCSH